MTSNSLFVQPSAFPQRNAHYGNAEPLGVNKTFISSNLILGGQIGKCRRTAPGGSHFQQCTLTAKLPWMILLYD